MLSMPTLTKELREQMETVISYSLYTKLQEYRVEIPGRILSKFCDDFAVSIAEAIMDLLARRS